MEKFNVKDPDVKNKLIPLHETKRFVFGEKFKDLEVYNVPLDFLSYNKNNGRIFLGVNEKEKEGIDFDELDQNSFNDEIEQLIWDYDKQKNINTKDSIEKVGQLEIALISENGIVIDGNRRFTCLRRLHREFPNNPDFKYLKTCIIIQDEEITQKDIKKYELNVQFGKETIADYHLTDKVMSIYREVKSRTLTIDEIASEMNLSKSKVHGFVKTAEMINQFLEYYKISGNYFIVDKMSYVNPLEVLAKYVNNGKVAQELSESEKITRRNIFFELLVGAKLHLPTQDLRDGLIRDIYKKNQQLCEEFIEEYDLEVSQRFYDLVEELLDNGDFYEFRRVLQQDDVTSVMNRIFQKYRDKANIEKTLEQQILLAEKALDSVREIDIDMLTNVENPEVEAIYNKVLNVLKKVNKEVMDIVDEE